MRFLMVVAIWIVIVGGLWSYISHRDAKRELIVAATPIDLSVEGNYALEITPTFSTEDDPFALKNSDNTTSSFEVKLNGNALDMSVLEFQRGETIRNAKVGGVLTGHNEIYVNASPPLSENTLEHGIRVKFYQDNALVVDRTVWADQGALVSGAISFNLSQTEEASHDH
jgi:hypothetical protein